MLVQKHFFTKLNVIDSEQKLEMFAGFSSDCSQYTQSIEFKLLFTLVAFIVMLNLYDLID